METRESQEMSVARQIEMTDLLTALSGENIANVHSHDCDRRSRDGPMDVSRHCLPLFRWAGKPEFGAESFDRVAWTIASSGTLVNSYAALRRSVRAWRASRPVQRRRAIAARWPPKAMESLSACSSGCARPTSG